MYYVSRAAFLSHQSLRTRDILHHSEPDFEVLPTTFDVCGGSGYHATSLHSGWPIAGMEQDGGQEEKEEQQEHSEKEKNEQQELSGWRIITTIWSGRVGTMPELTRRCLPGY